MIVKLIDFLRDRLQATIHCCYAVLALLVLWDIFGVDKSHAAHTWVEKHIPGWWSIFGFVACVLIIILSKWFGHFKWPGGFRIMSPEDYYDK